MVMEMVLTEVKTTIEQSQGERASARALGDWTVEDERDMRRHRGDDIAAMRHQVCLAVWASKSRVTGLPSLDLKNQERMSGRHVASSEGLHRGKAAS